MADRWRKRRHCLNDNNTSTSLWWQGIIEASQPTYNCQKHVQHVPLEKKASSVMFQCEASHQSLSSSEPRLFCLDHRKLGRALNVFTAPTIDTQWHVCPHLKNVISKIIFLLKTKSATIARCCSWYEEISSYECSTELHFGHFVPMI